MRTTVDIPDPTYRRLKERAAQQGSSVKKLILDSVAKELGKPEGPRKRVRLPLVRSSEPGSLNLTNEQLYEFVPFP